MTEEVLAYISSFRGNTEHGLDSKGRLHVPARFRDVLAKKYDERLVIVPWRDCLRVYPLVEWAKFEQLLMTGNLSPKKNKQIRILTGRSAELQIDKNGRILIPAQMRKDSDLDNSLILTGMGSFFEIWDQEKYAALMELVGDEDFDDLEETIHEMNLF